MHVGTKGIIRQIRTVWTRSYWLIPNQTSADSTVDVLSMSSIFVPIFWKILSGVSLLADLSPDLQSGFGLYRFCPLPEIYPGSISRFSLSSGFFPDILKKCCPLSVRLTETELSGLSVSLSAQVCSNLPFEPTIDRAQLKSQSERSFR